MGESDRSTGGEGRRWTDVTEEWSWGAACRSKQRVSQVVSAEEYHITAQPCLYLLARDKLRLLALPHLSGCPKV